jgi:hypothetical protein
MVKLHRQSEVFGRHLTSCRHQADHESDSCCRKGNNIAHYCISLGILLAQRQSYGREWDISATCATSKFYHTVRRERSAVSIGQHGVNTIYPTECGTGPRCAGHCSKQRRAEQVRHQLLRASGQVRGQSTAESSGRRRIVWQEMMN